MKNIVILGSTGSIGRNALKVLENFPHAFKVVGLSAHSNLSLLKKQIEKFKPRIVAVTEENNYLKIKNCFQRKGIKVLYGEEGLKELARLPEVDLLINALVGAVGLVPTLLAIESGKNIALANKEALVMAGELITQKAKEKNVEILPIDSEHSAIKQCLMSGKKEEVAQLILTASGGPFYFSKKTLSQVTVKEALAHPTWEMGKKITIDSATLMNKGLEVIEAHWFFDIPGEKIKVLIHPQSIIHSMVEYVDGSVIAQMSIPDMRLPIQYALFYPNRVASANGNLDLSQIKNLTFAEPNFEKFPCLKLAYSALKKGGTAPTILNASNEIAVKLFLEKKITLNKIPMLIERVLTFHKIDKKPNLEEILLADKWAREKTWEQASKITK